MFGCGADGWFADRSIGADHSDSTALLLASRLLLVLKELSTAPATVPPARRTPWWPGRSGAKASTAERSSCFRYGIFRAQVLSCFPRKRQQNYRLLGRAAHARILPRSQGSCLVAQTGAPIVGTSFTPSHPSPLVILGPA